MIINPFISIDEQLRELGWDKYHEGETGFNYVKKMGDEIWFIALYSKNDGIKFFDPILESAIYMNEKELALFAAKIKEWRRQNECTNKGGRHFSKEQS